MNGTDHSATSPSRDYFSRRRNVEELLHLGDDDSGYIEGKVFMTWPPRNKLHRINLEVAEGSEIYRFELEVLHRDDISFRAHERVSFALKGASVDRRKASSAPHYLPIILRYPNGVVFRYLTGVHSGKVIDTWEGNTDEWYNPGTIHTVSDAIIADESDIHRGPIRTEACSSNMSVPPVTTTENATVAQLMPPAQQPRTEKRIPPAQVKARKRRKLKKGKVSLSPVDGTDGGVQTNIAVLPYKQPHALVNGSSASASDSYTKVNNHPDGMASISEHGEHTRADNYSTAAVAGEDTAPILQLKAGICTQRGDTFTALNDLQAGNSFMNVIGVVNSVNPERRTRTNDWSRSFTIVDPSVVDLPQQCIMVNCFQKKYREWLPQVQKDNTVILRKLKIVEFNGKVSATGYNDKLRWAIYDPVNHCIQHPDKGNAPDKESVDDGLGYEFSPYWEPFQDSNELEYCRQIQKWWKAKQELGGHKVSVVVCSAPPPKRHLLISEASPDLPPMGFFNCTVEVLQKFNNRGSAATTVYVTDYTSNPLMNAVQATWCPPGLSGRVLQCNMWDSAKEIAEIMSPGEYWYLHNIRARWNPGQCMEGTMQLAEKVAQLDEANVDALPHLKALLARKKDFGANKSLSASGLTSSHIFPHMLFQDVEASTTFLTCVVELLHMDLNSQDGHFIYVTDYTFNPDLPITVSSVDWTRNLDRRVVKIKLDDTQAKMSSDLELGCVYIIHNLRIKRSGVSSEVHGCLGGEDAHIVSLRDLSSNHAEALRRNKEKWAREEMLNVPPPWYGGSNEPNTSSITTTLQEVLASPAPNVFTVLARIVDFCPFSLQDACALRCTKCHSSPPPSFKRCPRCDDMMVTHCRWFYHLHVELQDEEGVNLIVSLSGKECTLFQGVDPTDFRCDHEAFNKFQMKIDPILGNLKEVHEALLRNERVDVESPLVKFTLESWNIGDRGKAYGVITCTLA